MRRRPLDQPRLQYRYCALGGNITQGNSRCETLRLCGILLEAWGPSGSIPSPPSEGRMAQWQMRDILAEAPVHHSPLPSLFVFRRIIRCCCKGCTSYCQASHDDPVATVSSCAMITFKVRNTDPLWSYFPFSDWVGKLGGCREQEQSGPYEEQGLA